VVWSSPFVANHATIVIEDAHKITVLHRQPLSPR
jgi:hypothetical protein